ncbi:MAG: PA14 domain-containing protein [Cyclobacteriaceae bacterium]|nr:PA14 domain-containing protein [Cyclobacteriaceae bacterium]
MLIPKLDTLELEREIVVDSISATMTTGNNPQKLLVFEGKMNIPETGEYIFQTRLIGGGALLLINGDTIVDRNGDFSRDNLGVGSIELNKGTVPFTFIYNKFKPYQRGVILSVEGPGIQQYELTAPGSWPVASDNSQSVIIELAEETVLQRGFFNHGDRKRTHIISVGSPQDIHYAFDLSFGSLVQVWGDGFLDVTKMWVGRGGEQLSVPVGIPVLIHGDPDFAFLKDKKTVWPDTVSANGSYRQLGYKLDKGGNPTFITGIGSSKVTNKFFPSDTLRRLSRIITTDSEKSIWHKIGEGSIIEELPDKTYAIDDKSYFVDFSGNGDLKPFIRQSSGRDELLIEIPAGNLKITYQLTW